MKELKKVEILRDEETCSVVGGVGRREIGEGVVIGSGAVAVASLISSFGCQIASATYAVKANKADKNGDHFKADELRRASKNTGIAAASLTGAAFATALVGVGVGLPTGGLQAAVSDGEDFLTDHGFCRLS